MMMSSQMLSSSISSSHSMGTSHSPTITACAHWLLLLLPFLLQGACSCPAWHLKWLDQWSSVLPGMLCRYAAACADVLGGVVKQDSLP